MNKFYFGLLILSFILVGSVFAAQLNSDCSFKSSCSAGEILLFKVTSNTNAHAELFNQNNYQTLVCCSGSSLSNSCQTNGATVLRLSSATNAHVEQNTLSNYGQRVCLSSTDGTPASCSYASDCSSLGSNYKCVAEISSATNAHVGDCNSPYTTKVCCAVPGITSGVNRINLNLVPDTLQIGGQTSTVTAEACLDINCNTHAPDGTLINFNLANVQGGPNIGTLSSGSAQTVNGIATVTFTSGNQAGTGDIHGSAGSVDEQKTITVTGLSSCVISNVEIRDTSPQGNLIPSGQVVLAGTDVKFKFTATNCLDEIVNYQIWEMDNPASGPLTEDNDVSAFTSPPQSVQITQNTETVARLWRVQHRFNIGDNFQDGDLEWEYAFKAAVDGNALRSINYIQLLASSLVCRIDQAQIIHPTDDNYIYADGVTLDKQLPVRFRVYTSGDCTGESLGFRIYDVDDFAGVKDPSQEIPNSLGLINLGVGGIGPEENVKTWITEYNTGDNEGDPDIEYMFVAVIIGGPERDSDNWIQVQDIALPECRDNGIIDPGEDCDGSNLNAKRCESISHTPPFTGGNLSCVPSGYPNQCRYDTSQCTTDEGGSGDYRCGGRRVTYEPRCNPPGSYCTNSYFVCANDCRSCIGIDGNIKTILTRTPCRDDGNGDNVGVYEETTVQVNINTNQPIGSPVTVPKECTLTSEVDIPFFTPLNIIMVLVLISIYYFFMKTKNKKRIRKV